MEFNHIPIMLNTCIEALNVKPDGIYVDCTLGGGGHSAEILKRLDGGRLIAFDKDLEAIVHCKVKFADCLDKIIFCHNDYADATKVLSQLPEIKGVDGVLMDLGVSSYQLDNPSRGFSYMSDAPLDMRMDTSQQLSARVVCNEYDEDQLFRVIRDYGEDQFAKNIAKNIVKYRQTKPLETTLELVDVIDKSIPYSFKKNGHPAKKTFQAIRIEVNGELVQLEQTVRGLVDKLNVGGRIAILTFHSLEDRIIKNTFKDLATGCICPSSFPICVCNHKAKVKLLCKATEADQEEINSNPRAKSAKLRVAEKIEE